MERKKRTDEKDGRRMTAEIAKRCTGVCNKCPVSEICRLLRERDIEER